MRTEVTYVNLRKVLLEKQNEPFVFLEAGEHSYPFDFVLPNGIPTSFEYHRGHIRYWVQGVIDKQWSLKRYTHKMFTVLNMYDLNSKPNLTVPIGVNERIDFCCGPCRTEPINITLEVKKSKPVFIFSFKLRNYTLK